MASAWRASKAERRPKKRKLFYQAHPNQQIKGNGNKYYLHLLKPQQLQQRGMAVQKGKC